MDATSMDVTDVITSTTFLSKDDVSPGEELKLTITAVEWTGFKDKEGNPQPKRPQLTLDDGRKWSLNVTNTRVLAKYFGKDASQWVGRNILVWHDETVTYGPRMVGGLRVRVPTEKPAAVGHDDSPVGI